MEDYKILILTLIIILMLEGVALFSHKEMSIEWLNRLKTITLATIFASAVVGVWVWVE